MRTGEKDAAPKTNMEPKNWWFVDVSPFPKGLFSGSMLVFRGCINRFFSKKRFWALFFSFFGATSPKRALQRWVFFIFAGQILLLLTIPQKIANNYRKLYWQIRLFTTGASLQSREQSWTRCPF